MKKLIFLTALACSSCGSTFAIAQSRTFTSDANSSLILSEPGADSSLAPVPPQAPSEEIPDPFSYGGDLSPSDVVPEPPVLAEVAQDESDQLADPESLLSDENGARKSSAVDEMANYATLAGVRHASHGAVDWNYGMGQTPNPVAEYMLRQDCVDGLWDGYAQERARQCQEQWAHIHGLNRLFNCQHHGGCANCGGSHNRYSYSHSCDTCSH